ncbi:DUF4157 domain-containing protein [Ferruginibacter sp. SUN002]|uniref:DUF4157 domain-containing protein n=1 Tax=Ferruginibacter sp. SUN002 TaxID=2937789 RepID=UPI003D3636A7
MSKVKIKENSFLAKLAAKKLHTTSVAMVLGNTIHLYNTKKEDFLKNESWVKHELCHVQQFKHYGFIKFILLYLWESIKNGYTNNRFEVEARAAEKL